jgi:hypothetical protein
MGDESRGPKFTAGGNQQIAYAEKGDATFNANVSNTTGAAEVDIIAELRALREIMGRLTVQPTASVALLDSAEKAAGAAEPRRDEVMSLVEGATKLAVGVNGFAEQADRLIPRLQHVAAWAGRAWDLWGPTLGL